jgi:hypothetical protein
MKAFASSSFCLSPLPFLSHHQLPFRETTKRTLAQQGFRWGSGGWGVVVGGGRGVPFL